jgi:Domain of unknown function (DUF4177)
MHQWEYKTVRLTTKGLLGGVLDTEDFDQKLNELGSNGWEMISTYTNVIYGSSRDVVAVFKRQRI